MKNLKTSAQEIKESGMYSFKTIEDFGWGDHIDNSRGGLVINFKCGSTIIANQNVTQTGFDFAYKYDLDDTQDAEIKDLFDWIAE